MKKAKILLFVDRLRVGGIQTLLLEIVEHINKDKFDVDILLLDDGEKYEMEERFKGLGCQVHKLEGIWIRKPKDYVTYAKAMNRFFAQHHDYVAVHMNSSSKNFLVLYYAKKYGIKTRISHSHNIGFQTKSKMQVLVGDMLKHPLKKYSNYFLACSTIAGEWLFGKRVVESSNFSVLHNGIDVEKFGFSALRRDEMRRQLGIEDSFVLGHVGRFTKQKNHTFLIDIFNEVHKRNDKAVLMLIGIGEEEENIRKKVETFGLTDSVLFVGFKSNVADYMQAMDSFVFPSLFEGLGIVLIEAQTAGLPCFTSKDVVPQEAKVTNLLEFIELEAGAEEWAKKMCDKVNSERSNYIRIIKENGYDIRDTVAQLEMIYNGNGGENK